MSNYSFLGKKKKKKKQQNTKKKKKKKKKKPTSPEQDIDMKTELEHRIREAYQYADVLKNQMTTYDDPKWIKFILSSSHLNSVTCNIRTYLTATQTHEKRS